MRCDSLVVSPQVSFFSCKDNTLNVLLVTSSSIDRFKLNRGLLLLVISGKEVRQG